MTFREGMAARQLILEEHIGVLIRAASEEEEDEFSASRKAIEQKRHLE